ncbi:class I SAM-dependent methyltransferase [Nakamurella flava]|uniref:Class I SAM-dependent methyltransferase n=1 Tax=Nakamurella flava TaxID=2576308 RepID=A0A4U6QA95_9ACTN|nr:cyclopropane-fatty-acyl-phospholipid synthase family protein [Nakamurella flava]TKV56829.1 class I SAM-dependent methyltransferase [Nakamurella flava]
MALLSPSRTPAIPRPAAGVWPGLFDVPRSPIHAAVARRLTRAAVSSLPISLTFPDGTTWGTGGPRLQVVRPDLFFRRLGTDGLIGFGEAWMTGDLTSGDWHPAAVTGSPTGPTAERINEATDELAAALTVMARRMSVLVPEPLQKLRSAWQRRPPLTADNTPTNARENIHRHYDLSNDLFELFLDPTMTYSSAWFEPGDDLRAAQIRKIDGILDLARVGPGMRILEIGSGWGALAIRAATERGARVTTLTLSQEQKALAERRIAEAGVSDRVDVVLQDYRDHAAVAGGAYDAVVSVEMIEAVGERYWPDYFTAVDRMLADGGRFAVQAITMAHERLLATRNGYTWVHKYVFPGGMLPSMTAIEDVTKAHTGLRVSETRRLGPSYVPTLAEWRHRFNDRLPQVRALGFDETFIRMWNFYLAYSEAGFAAEYLDVWQLGLSR